jgi:hypothetical protein
MPRAISEHRPDLLSMVSIPPEQATDGDFLAFAEKGIFIRVRGKTRK